MNRRKMNISLWSLGLAVMLMAACLVGATGTSLARYRAETTEDIRFTARLPQQIRLGQLVTDAETGEAVFDPNAQGAWERVDGQNQLKFAVSNMIDAETNAAEDQQVSLRLVASPGVWDGTNTVTVRLMIPREEDPARVPEEDQTESTENTEAPPAPYDVFEATATRISVDSPLYNVFGDGWVFSFLDEDGGELSWMLEGGELSVLEMTLTLEGLALTDPSLLQLQITGDFT